MPSCDPADLSVLAKPFANLNSRELEAIKTYLLAVRAGGSTDPSVLMDDAKCFMCMKDNQLKAIQTQLLCTISSGGTGSCAALAGDAPPTGLVTPEFIGQLYNRNSGESFWYSTGLTNADWVEITGGGMVWSPNANSIAVLAMSSDLSFGVPSDVEFPKLVTISDFAIIDTVLDVSSLSFPVLTTVTNDLNILALEAMTSLDLNALISTGDSITIDDNILMTSLDTSSLTTVGSYFELKRNDVLTTISFPALTTIVGDTFFNANPLLANVSMPVFLPTNGTTINFQGDALTAASVNHILARCVANAGYVTGTVSLNLGTNAAPSGQGVADKATLIGRGCVVNTN